MRLLATERTDHTKKQKQALNSCYKCMSTRGICIKTESHTNDLQVSGNNSQISFTSLFLRLDLSTSN